MMADAQGIAPRVSVVIPTRDRAPLLRRALDSVFAQTCADYEVIVVDDASTDDTASMLAGIADSRLHLAIATVTGSPMVVEAVTRAQAALGELLGAIPVLRTNIEHSHDQHDTIVAAILTGDPDTARTTMEEHCDATSALLRGLIG